MTSNEENEWIYLSCYGLQIGNFLDSFLLSDHVRLVEVFLEMQTVQGSLKLEKLAMLVYTFVGMSVYKL